MILIENVLVRYVSKGMTISRNYRFKGAGGLFACLSQQRVNGVMDEKIATLPEAVAAIEHRVKDEQQYAVCLRDDDAGPISAPPTTDSRLDVSPAFLRC